MSASDSQHIVAKSTAATAFQPGCNPSTGAVRPVEGGNYERQGTQCKHSHPTSWKDIDWSNRTQEADFDELDNSCLALEELNMCVYKPLNMILCRSCEMLLDCTTLLGHLQNDAHRKSVPTVRSLNTVIDTKKDGKSARAPPKVTFFIKHITLAFNLNKSFPDHAIVHRPLPFMPVPEIFDHCPACNAAFVNKKQDLFNTKRVLQHHFKQIPDCGRSEAVKAIKMAQWTPEQTRKDSAPVERWEAFAATRKYGQFVYPGFSGVPRRVVYFSEGWRPISTANTDGSNSNTDITNVDADVNEQLPDSVKEPIIQDYIEKLGWDDVFRTSADCNLINVWKQMLSSIPEHPRHKYTEEELKQEAALEEGLPHVRVFLLEYLQDANKWVKGCSEIFRRQITEMEEAG